MAETFTFEEAAGGDASTFSFEEATGSKPATPLRRTPGAPKKSPLDLIQTSPSGQNFIGVPKEFMESPSSGSAILDYLQAPNEAFGRLPLALAKGARDIGVGVTTLPFDIAGFLGSETAAEIADTIRKTVPEIRIDDTASEVSAALVQFGVPAGTAAKLAAEAARGAPKAVKFLSIITAAAGADVAVAVPGQDKSIGDIVGGPTEMQPGDSPLTQRAKIGAESAVIGTALPPVFRAGRAVYDKTKNFVAPIFSPTEAARRAVAKSMRDHLVTPLADVEKNLESAKSLRDGGFQPTTGTLSNDPALIGAERGLVTDAKTSPQFVQRKIENEASVGRDVESVTGTPASGDPEAPRRAFETQRNNQLAAAERQLTQTERDLVARELEVENEIDAFAQSGRGRQAAASVEIDEFAKAELNRITAKKNELFDAIDPDRVVPLDTKRLRPAFSQLLAKKGPADNAVDRIPPALVKSLDEILDPANPAFLGDLADLRPELSTAIAAARAGNDGALATRLSDFKAAVEREYEILAMSSGKGAPAKRAAAKRAADALDYYKSEYVPKFRQGVGSAYRQAARQGKPVAGSATGSYFLNRTTGASESAQQLRQIAEGAPDAEAALSSIRNHLIADVADLMANSNRKTALGRLDRYLDQRGVRETLDKFREVRDEIFRFRSRVQRRVESADEFGQAVDAARAGLSQTKNDLALSATRFFVDRSPMKAVGAALRGNDPVAAMKELTAAAKLDKSGEAIKGLRIAVGQYVEDIVKSNRTDAILPASVAKILKGESRKALLDSGLYNRRDLAILDRAHEKMRIMDRINTQVTAGSPTAALKSQTDTGRIILASMYGIVKGRGIFAISKGVQRALGADPVAKAEALLAEAMLNPDVALTLLRSSDSPKAIKALEDRMLTFALNNLAPEEQQ